MTGPCILTLRLDQRTYDFLQALRDVERVNIDRYITEAIRAKAGMMGEPKPCPQPSK